MVRRVTGLGGVFFKADAPEKLYAWYGRHLGLARDSSEAVTFRGGDIGPAASGGMTVWSIFPNDTRYFDPSRTPFMLNYRVEDLDALLEVLAQEGVSIDPRREEYEYGKFAWITDPEGNRIELWQPKP